MVSNYRAISCTWGTFKRHNNHECGRHCWNVQQVIENPEGHEDSESGCELDWPIIHWRHHIIRGY